MAHPSSQEDPSDRSIWGTTALLAGVMSLTALLVLVAADAGKWKGFSDRKGDTTAGDLMWVGFAVAAIVALATGLVALSSGRRSAQPGDTRAGRLGVASFAVGVLVAVVASVLAED